MKRKTTTFLLSFLLLLSIGAVSGDPVVVEVWTQTKIGDGIDWVWDVAVGDGNNNGDNEVYTASNYIHQFRYSGSWSRTTVGDAGWRGLRGVAVGDGDNDGENEVYGAGKDCHIYQFKYSGGTWTKTDLGASSHENPYTHACDMHDVVVGDGDNDGENEVYGGSADLYLYQFKYSGSSWTKTELGNGGHEMDDLVVGDGNNDGDNEVYGANWDNHVYQFKYSGSSWTKTDLGTSNAAGLSGVSVGDGNNDGDNEVYISSTGLDYIYQFKFSGSTWIRTSLGGSGMWGVGVGDGNNDGQNEVYGGCTNDHMYKFKYINGSWTKTDMGGGDDLMNGGIVGDGDNDGKNEVYGSITTTSKVYQFKAGLSNVTGETTTTTTTLAPTTTLPPTNCNESCINQGFASGYCSYPQDCFGIPGGYDCDQFCNVSMICCCYEEPSSTTIPSVPEFGSIGVLAMILLMAPVIAYLFAVGLRRD
jgi:hypothetical protein